MAGAATAEPEEDLKSTNVTGEGHSHLRMIVEILLQCFSDIVTLLGSGISVIKIGCHINR